MKRKRDRVRAGERLIVETRGNKTPGGAVHRKLLISNTNPPNPPSSPEGGVKATRTNYSEAYLGSLQAVEMLRRRLIFLKRLELIKFN